MDEPRTVGREVYRRDHARDPLVRYAHDYHDAR